MEQPGDAAQEPEPADAGGFRITSIPIESAGQMFRAAGGGLDAEERIRKNIAAGAPVNGDGTLNLVHYAAWLARRAAHGA